MAPELERLNELGYRLPLNDSEIKRMQNLNRSWSAASAQTTERFRYQFIRSGPWRSTVIIFHIAADQCCQGYLEKVTFTFLIT